MRSVVLSSKIEINFTHADVESLTEILNSVVTEEFFWLWMHFKRFRVFGIGNVQ